jgi:hypothetical protein
MESLALLVALMLFAELLFGLVAVTFAALARFRGRFRRTALILIALLAVETAWALWTLPAFGFPSLVALVLSAGVFWWPKRPSARPPRS